MSIQERPLNEKERAHVNAVIGSRPEWDATIIQPLHYDEAFDELSHEYGPLHVYTYGLHDTLRTVMALAPCDVLDIGSPIDQTVAISCVPGVNVTMMDVRQHSTIQNFGIKFIKGSALNIPYEDNSVQVITSLCVICHVGDGRYGDEFVPDGDIKFLKEVYRVLKPGGVAILGLGPISDKAAIMFNMHRQFSWKWLNEVFDDIGFSVLRQNEHPSIQDLFYTEEWKENSSCKRSDGMYGFVVLGKH